MFFFHTAAFTSVSLQLIYVRSTCMGHLSQFVRLYWRYVIALLFSCHASHKGVVSQVQTEGRKEIQSAGRKKLKTFASKFPLRGARTEEWREEIKQRKRESSRRKTSVADKWPKMDKREGNKWASKTCKSNGRAADGGQGCSSYGDRKKLFFGTSITSAKAHHRRRDYCTIFLYFHVVPLHTDIVISRTVVSTQRSRV